MSAFKVKLLRARYSKKARSATYWPHRDDTDEEIYKARNRAFFGGPKTPTEPEEKGHLGLIRSVAWSTARWVSSLTGRPADRYIDDAIQELTVVCLRSIREFEQSPQYHNLTLNQFLLSRMYGVRKNLVIQMVNEGGTQGGGQTTQELDVPMESEGGGGTRANQLADRRRPERFTSHLANRELIEKALEQVPEPYRTILRMWHLEEQDLDTISDATAKIGKRVSPSTIKNSYLTIGKSKLSRILTANFGIDWEDVVPAMWKSLSSSKNAK